MVAVMMLLAVLAGQAPCAVHVRTNEPRILRLLDLGRERSDTFRALVERLEKSDVIVYISPKQTHAALGGFLSHRVIAAGPCRYLRVKVRMAGSDRLLLALIAHELQHVAEVAEHPDARDATSVAAMFEKIAVNNGCVESNCAETQAAIAIQLAVSGELGAIRTTQTLTSSRTITSEP